MRKEQEPLENIISDMRANVRAYHNAEVMPRTRIDQMSITELLALCHPTDRAEFKERVNRYERHNEKQS